MGWTARSTVLEFRRRCAAGYRVRGGRDAGRRAGAAAADVRRPFVSGIQITEFAICPSLFAMFVHLTF
jgi:hypothetical protein